MTASASGEESPLANKCFDFCKALASQGMAFSFSLTLGSNFSFSLDTREMAPHSVNEDKAWKKKSPSTIRRNARRREEFLQKKQSPAAVPARPLNILPSPTDSSGRRQVVSLGRDPTAPSFTHLDGVAGVFWLFEWKDCKEESCNCCHCIVITCPTLNLHINV